MDPDYKYESDKDRRLVEDLSDKIPTNGEIPTPETDAHLDIYAYPEEAVHQNWADFARHLERRLTIAHEALKRLDNWLMRDAQRKQITEQALTLTAPKL